MKQDPSVRPIRFVHRDRIVEVQDLPPTTTVLSWLREHARCTGTKEGCNEGDCGACTVVVAEAVPGPEPVGPGHSGAAPQRTLRLSNLNACLLFLPALDGRALFTVEDLRGLHGGELHPVQQAMVDCHGSQCGFCTPGFVMSIWAAWEQALNTGQAPDRQGWADALAGNLCRCTGYRPILDAAAACVEAGRQQPEAARLDRARVLDLLTQLEKDPPLHYEARDEAVGDRRRFCAPRSSDELASHLMEHPQDRILGGATDIGLWVNKAHRDVGHLVAVARAEDLDRIEADGRGLLSIGAAVSLERAWRALAEDWPALQDLWRRFASPPVRHAGTLAGNLANGSPIGDSAPVLMALGARLVLRKGAARREVALEDFYLGYQRNRLESGEFIETVSVPRPRPGAVMRAWKISKRYDSDISAVCGGLALEFDGPRLVQARMAFGGMAATVRRASTAEQALLKAGWSEAGIQAAATALPQDFQPLSDLRASADHRLEAAAAMLRRLWLSLGPQPWNTDGSSSAAEAPMLEVWR